MTLKNTIRSEFACGVPFRPADNALIISFFSCGKWEMLNLCNQFRMPSTDVRVKQGPRNSQKTIREVSTDTLDDT
jgi:hypothetical protein